MHRNDVQKRRNDVQSAEMTKQRPQEPKRPPKALPGALGGWGGGKRGAADSAVVADVAFGPFGTLVDSPAELEDEPIEDFSADSQSPRSFHGFDSP